MYGYMDNFHRHEVNLVFQEGNVGKLYALSKVDITVTFMAGDRIKAAMINTF